MFLREGNDIVYQISSTQEERQKQKARVFIWREELTALETGRLETGDLPRAKVKFIKRKIKFIKRKINNGAATSLRKQGLKGYNTCQKTYIKKFINLV